MHSPYLKLFVVSVFVTFAGIVPVVLPAISFAQDEEATAEADTEEPTGEGNQTDDETTDSADSEGAADDDASRDEVEELKEKVESTVDNLQNENLTTYAGFIDSLEDEVMTLDTENGEVAVELDPELTIYYQIQSNATEEIDSEDVEAGDFVLVSGPKIGNTVTANAVYKDVAYLVRTGKIIEVNEDSFYITVQTLDKDTFTLDIEQSTTQQLLDIKTFELETSGFSKMKTGDTIHFVVEQSNEEDTERYEAVKTIIIPQEYFIKEGSE